MDVLLLPVEYQGAAVHQLAAQADAVFDRQLQQDVLAQLAQIAGDDGAEILRAAVEIFKMRPNGGVGRRG